MREEGMRKTGRGERARVKRERGGERVWQRGKGEEGSETEREHRKKVWQRKGKDGEGVKRNEGEGKREGAKA